MEGEGARVVPVVDLRAGFVRERLIVVLEEGLSL